MSGIDRLVAGCLSLAADGTGSLTLAGVLQGFPDTAHGGGVLAVFDLVAARRVDGPARARTVSAQIQRSVPLETRLPLASEALLPDVALTLGEAARPLARGLVSLAPPAPGPAWDGWRGPTAGSLGFPTSRGCLACGSDNPMGLRVRLRFDEEWVWAEYDPPETYRTADGRLAPALFTVLLDEAAWWLGALAAAEAGVTTDLRVRLHRPGHAFGGPVLAVGPRRRVAATDRRGHFWRTETAVLDAGGAPLASAEIIYAASRVYSRRLVPDLLRDNPPESLRPIFPAYVP